MSAIQESRPMHVALQINRHQQMVEDIVQNAQHTNWILPPPPPSSTSRYSRPILRVTKRLFPLSYHLIPLPMRPAITSLHVLEMYLKKAMKCKDVEVMFYLLPRAPACSVRRILLWAMRHRKPNRLGFLQAAVHALGSTQSSTGSDEPIPCECFVHALPEVEMTFREDKEHDKRPVSIRRKDLTQLQENILTAVRQFNPLRIDALLSAVSYRDVRNLLMYTAVRNACGVVNVLARAVELDKSDAGLLVYTIQKGCAHQLEELLLAGFPANSLVFDDIPVLMLRMPSLQHYWVLLENGADPNLRYEKTDSLVKTPFMAAMMRGDVDLMKLLLEKKANIKDVIGKNDFVFELVCTPHFNVPLVSLLITHGLDINVRNRQGETLVHAALLQADYQLMCLLIEKGADVNTTDRDGITPLIRSAQIGKMFTDRLLAAGADINPVDRWSRNVMVSWLFEGNESVVIELLDRGASCDLRSDEWGTPILLTLRFPNPFNEAIDKMLHNMSNNELAKKELLDFQDIGLPSALCQAVVDMCLGKVHSLRTVEILLQHGASWDTDPDLKDTLIHAIVSRGSFTTFQAAMKRHVLPVDCSVVKLRSCLDMPIVSCSTDKVSPLYVALYFGHWPLAEFMMRIHYLTPSDTRMIAGYDCLHEHLFALGCTKSTAVLEDFHKQPLRLETLALIKVSNTCKGSSRDIEQLGLPKVLARALAYVHNRETGEDPLMCQTSEHDIVHGLSKDYVCACPVKGPFFR